MPGLLKELKDMSAASGGPHHGALLHHAPRRFDKGSAPGGGGGHFSHHYKPINHGGRVEEEQGLIDTELLETGDVVLRVTRLAGGFVCGPQSRSLHEIKRVTGCLIRSWIDTWPCPGGGPDKDCSMFMVGGPEKAVVAGIDLITAAVDRYKELREGKRQGTGQNQLVMGVTFTYYDRGVCAVRPFNETLHANSAPCARGAAPSSGYQQHDGAAGMHNGHQLLDSSSTGPRIAAQQDGVLSAAAALPLLYLTRSQVETLVLVQDFWWAHCQDLVGTVNLPFSLKGAMVLCKGKLHVIFRMLERKGGNVVEVSCGTKWMASKLYLRIADLCDDPFEALDPQLLPGLRNTYERTVAKDEAPQIRVEQVKKVRYWLLRLSQAAPHVQQALLAEACEDPDVTQAQLESAVQATIKAVQLPRTPEETKYLNDIIQACMCAEAEPGPADLEPAVQPNPSGSQRATFLREQPIGSTAGEVGLLRGAPGSLGSLEPADGSSFAVAHLQSPSPRIDKLSVFARLGGQPNRVSPASNGAHASMHPVANGHAGSHAPIVSPRTRDPGYVADWREGRPSNGAVGRPVHTLGYDAGDRRSGAGHGGIPMPGSRGAGGSTGAGAGGMGYHRQASLRLTTARVADIRSAEYRSVSLELNDGRRRHGDRSRSREPSHRDDQRSQSRDRRHSRSRDWRRSRSRNREGIQRERGRSRSRSGGGRKQQRSSSYSRAQSRSRERRRSRSPDGRHSRHDGQRSRSGERLRSRSRDRKRTSSRDRKRSSSQDRQRSRHDRQRSKTREKRHMRSKDRRRSRSGGRKRSKSRDRRRTKSRERHVAGAQTEGLHATGLDRPPPTAEISPAQARAHSDPARPGDALTATAKDHSGRGSPPSYPQQRSPSPSASGRWPMVSAPTPSTHQASQDLGRPYVRERSPSPSANGHKHIHTSSPPGPSNDHTDRTVAYGAMVEPNLGHVRDQSPAPTLPPASPNGHATYSFPVLRPASPGERDRDYASPRYQPASPVRRLQGRELLRTQTALHLLYLTRGQIQTLVEVQDFWWLHCQHLVDSQGFPFNPSGIMVIGQGRLQHVERLVEHLGGWAVEVAIPPGVGRRHLISLQDLCSQPLDALDRYQVAHACAEYDEAVMCGDMPAVTVKQVENVQHCMLRMDQAVPFVNKLLLASADPNQHQEGLAVICKDAQRGVLRALHDPMTQQEVSYVQHTIEDAITASL